MSLAKPMAMSNFNELEDSFLRGSDPSALHEIHERLEGQRGMFRLFADVAELFVPQTVNTFFKMMGVTDDVVKPRQSGPPGDLLDSGNIPGGRG